MGPHTYLLVSKGLGLNGWTLIKEWDRGMGKKPPHRDGGIDLLRALAVFVMVLEHARFITSGNPVPVTSDPYCAHGLGGLSRLCAPIFFLLMGWSIQEKLLRNGPLKNGAAGSPFFQRGVKLILFQFLLINPLWWLGCLRHEGSHGGLQLYVGVLGVLGLTMILVAPLLSRTSTAVLLCTALALSALGWSAGGPSVEVQGSGLSRILIHGRESGWLVWPYPLVGWMAFSVWGGLLLRLERSGHLRDSMGRLGMIFFLGFLTAIYLDMDIRRLPPSSSLVLLTFSCFLLSRHFFNPDRLVIPRVACLWGRQSLAIYLIHLLPLALFGLAWGRTSSLIPWLLASIFSLLISQGLAWRRDLNLNPFDALTPLYDWAMTQLGVYRKEEMKSSLGPGPYPVMLDIGGGTGWIMSSLRQEKSLAIVFDHSKGMLSRVRKPCLPIQGDAFKLPFRNGSVDAIICTEALHHIGNIEACLGEMHRVMKTHGRLVIMEFDPDSTWGPWLMFFEWLFIEKVKYFKPDELIAACSKVGFQMEAKPCSALIYLLEGHKHA